MCSALHTMRVSGVATPAALEVMFVPSLRLPPLGADFQEPWRLRSFMIVSWECGCPEGDAAVGHGQAIGSWPSGQFAAFSV